MSKKHKYQRLGGWLLFVVISLFLQLGGVLTQFGEGGMLDILRGWSMYDGAQGWLLMASQALSLLLIIAHVFVELRSSGATRISCARASRPWRWPPWISCCGRSMVLLTALRTSSCRC